MDGSGIFFSPLDLSSREDPLARRTLDAPRRPEAIDRDALVLKYECLSGRVVPLHLLARGTLRFGLLFRRARWIHLLLLFPSPSSSLQSEKRVVQETQGAPQDSSPNARN